MPEPKPKIPEIAEFEDDFSDVLAGLNDNEISELFGKYDDGPTPETPFKVSNLNLSDSFIIKNNNILPQSFGESSRDINQTVVERKRRKIDLNDNDNENENVTIKTENM